MIVIKKPDIKPQKKCVKPDMASVDAFMGALFLIACLALFLFMPADAEAKHLHSERYYQELWCDAMDGEAEVVNSDRTRTDCITKELACELDFARKWYEAIGQAMHYARLHHKTPCIVLIVEKESDEKYWDRMNATIEYYEELYELRIETYKIQ